MKIKDIVSEGWADVFKRLGTDVAGGDINVGATRDTLSKLTKGKVDPAAGPGVRTPLSADQTLEKGQLFLVKASNGQEYFKSFEGRWFERHGLPNTFSTTHEVKAQKDIQALDLIPASRGKVVNVVPDAPGSTTFIPSRKQVTPTNAGRQSVKQQLRQKGIKGR